MKIVLAPDSFKGSLTAEQACEAMARGVRRACPQAELLAVPMADGGEGTAEALRAVTGGRMVPVTATGPLPDGDRVAGEFALLGDRTTAVVEMARVSGLTLVPPAKRNPLHTTTYGTGELIAAALDTGIRRLIVAIGGSATCDGGAGMAQALGARFTNSAGSIIPQPMTGGLLAQVARVDLTAMHPRVTDCAVEVACDVDNPLLGPRGAAAVYGPQKGASPADVVELERNLTRLVSILEAAIGRSIRDEPGAGAAGGLGAGLVGFLGARLKPGVEIVLAASNLTERLAGADLVFTGEGCIDAQTPNGKTISGVVRAAATQNVPVIALAGRVGRTPADTEALAPLGLHGVHAIAPESMPLHEAMARAGELLTGAAEAACRQWLTHW